MTTDELKAHRRAICDALIEGRQCQLQVTDQWCDQLPQVVASNLFSKNWGPECIRIKPRESRKCWVAWSEKGSFWCATTEMEKRQVENDYPNLTIRWQPVTEEVK